MAFKRSSVRSRYPPLHNPLQNKGLWSFLDNAIEVGCGAGAIRELPAEEKRAIFPPMRMLDTQEPIGRPPDRVLPVRPRILSGAHGCLRPFPCRRPSGCGGCHWYFHCVYACLCHDLRHCLWASPGKNPHRYGSWRPCSWPSRVFSLVFCTSRPTTPSGRSAKSGRTALRSTEFIPFRPKKGNATG